MSTSIHKVYAGCYWSDGGALMGVLPWSIWSKRVETDDRHRLRMALNLLLIRSEDRNILVDTGLGNMLSEKQHKIYNPDEFMLPVSLGELGIRDIEITDVVMSHLHFDHAGGICSEVLGKKVLTFPSATYWIQKLEWEMANNPDGLNRAAYDKAQYELLAEEGKINLIEQDTTIAKGVKLVHTGGHTVGSQIVEIKTDKGFYIYPADIIPTMMHTHLPVTSAYDINREDTYKAKLYIYDTLKSHDGYLLLDHDNDIWEIPITELG